MRSLKGTKGIRYLVMTPTGDDRSCGKVISRHKKLAHAKSAAERRYKQGRLAGERPDVYVWDLTTDTEASA